MNKCQNKCQHKNALVRELALLGQAEGDFIEDVGLSFS
jgi:hypothetical protein